MTARLYLVGAAVLAVVAIGAAVYGAGRRDEARSVENRDLKATERQRTERDKIDAEARKMDDRDLCGWLDGLWRGGQCD